MTSPDVLPQPQASTSRAPSLQRSPTNGKSKEIARNGRNSPEQEHVDHDRDATAVELEIVHTRPRRILPTWLDPAPSLENSGSVARDHLANERTWLAYLRTSLSIASAGVALVQLFTISTTSNTTSQQIRRFVRPLGATVIIVGWSVLIIGGWRYFRVQFTLQHGFFPPARRTVGMISAALGIVVAVTFAFLLALAK